MTKRFQNSDDIVGQFLPKVYTRRITLEDTKTPTRNPPRDVESASQDRLFRPATAITVDYHIKDVLDESGLGVITNNQNQDEDPNQIQNEVLSSLKVAIMLFSDNSAFEAVLNTIRAFRTIKTLPSVMPSFEEYLVQAVQNLNRSTDKVVLQINSARPESLAYSVSNSQYQEYDVNNNLVNIIPYEHAFKVENLRFGYCQNLSLICFTYFDFSSLSLDELSSDEIRRLGYITGDITADVITRGNRIESTSLVYKDAITRSPYYGPVHVMGDGTIHTGMTHRESSRVLTSHQIPLTKIQDFRAMERLKETNYQPSEFQTFDSSIPSLDLIEKNNKDFFDVDNIVVDFDRIDKVANIEFTLDMASIYETTRYYDLMKSNQSAAMFGFPALMDILEVTVLRRRVTKRPIGHDRLGGYKRVPFDQVEDEGYIVATSGQGSSASGGVGSRNIITKEDGDAKIMELSVGGLAALVKRSFFVEDRQVADYLGTGAVFQYGVELRIKDPTKDRFITMLKTARSYLKDLHLYLQEASIPVFDSRMIKKQDPTQPISMDAVRDAPQYGEAVQQGNYNTVNKLLQRHFIRSARSKYMFNDYVENYLELIRIAFAKSEISMYKFSTPTQGGDGQRGQVREGTDEGNAAGVRATPMDLLMSEEGMSMDTAKTAMYNMINPSNARPETIQSFIKTYQDLVMDLEDYFDIGYEDSPNTEGGGYSARGDNTLHLQRWFSNVEENPDGTAIDSDNYIEMDPLQAVFFRYWREGDLLRGMGIPSVSAAAFADRMQFESTRYLGGAAPTSAIESMTPISIVIGNDEIFFDEEEMKREDSARRARQKAEDLERRQKLAKHREMQRLGRASKRKPYKRRLPVRRQILADPSQGKLISNFVEEIKVYQKNYGGPSANTIIGAMNSAPHYGTPTSGRSSGTASYARYFDFISSVTEEMVDGSFQYSTTIDGLEKANKVLTEADIEEYIASNVSCGLVDNRPSGNEIVEESNRFRFSEGLYPGIFNVIQTLPRMPSFPQIPQLELPNFPTGPEFAAAARSFPNNRASLPIPIPPIPIPTSTSSRSLPQPRFPTTAGLPSIPTGIPTGTNPGVGAVRVETAPRSAGRPTDSQSRRGGASRSAATIPTSRSTSPRAMPSTRSSNRSSAATSGASTYRAASGGARRTTGGMGGMGGRSGPRTGGYGY